MKSKEEILAILKESDLIVTYAWGETHWEYMEAEQNEVADKILAILDQQTAPLRQENERLKAQIRLAHDTGYVSGYKIGRENTHPAITNAWQLFAKENNL